MARIILISFEQKISEKNLDVIFESEDEVLVSADKDAIHQVLYNLMHNAVKFSKESGKLAISITSIDNKKVRISVYDEGQSINKEDLPFVFDRFYKTDESRGKDKNGVGLGLSIVRSIIKLHDGSVLVRSKPGEYTEFEFTLPQGNPPTRHSE